MVGKFMLNWLRWQSSEEYRFLDIWQRSTVVQNVCNISRAEIYAFYWYRHSFAGKWWCFAPRGPKQDLRERIFSYLFWNYVDLSSAIAIIFKSKRKKKLFLKHRRARNNSQRVLISCATKEMLTYGYCSFGLINQKRENKNQLELRQFLPCYLSS